MNFKVLSPQLGARGLTGAQIIQGTEAPEAEQGNDGDLFLRHGPEGDTQIYGPKEEGSWGIGRSIRGGQGLAGLRGWNPVLLTVPINVEVSEGVFKPRVLVRLSGWIGGQGSAPTTYVGQYVNAAGDGFTENETEALDLRGAPGINGVMSGMELLFDDDGTLGAEQAGKNIIADSADPITLSLDDATELGPGWMVLITNQGVGAATIQPAGDDEVNGEEDLVLETGQSVTLWTSPDGGGFRATRPSLDALFDDTLTRTPAQHAQARANIGAAMRDVRSVSNSIALDPDDLGKLINVSAPSGDVAITLPNAATVGAGWNVRIRKGETSTNAVTIATVSAQTIDGQTASKFKLTMFNDWFDLVSDGSNWIMMGQSPRFATGSFASPSATGDLTISGIGFRPKMVKLYGAGVTTNRFDVGFSVLRDGQSYTWSYAQDGSTTQSSGTIMSGTGTGSAIQQVNTAGTVVQQASVTFDFDQFVLNYTVSTSTFPSMVWEAHG